MRRKISLLLAFAMVLSILPMNVFASNPAVTGGGTRTGMLAEPAGPARNVRHFSGGNRVARQWLVDSVQGWAPQGNLRNILADAAYFAGRNDGARRASLTMNLHNADRWLGWPTRREFPPAISVWSTLSNNTSGGVAQFSGVTTPPVVSVPSVNWSNPSQILADNTQVPANVRDNFNTFVSHTIAANNNMRPDALVELVNSVNLLGALNPAIQASFVNEFFSIFSNPSLVALSIRTVPPTQNGGAVDARTAVGMNLPPGFPIFAAGIVTDTQTTAQLRVWRPFTSIADIPNGVRDWAVPSNGSLAAMTTDQMNSAVAFVTSTDNWVQLPIEFVTNGDTNDYPVYLTFFEQSGWPQAGQVRPGAGVPGRTDLTAVTDARFNFSVGGVGSLRRDNTEPIRTFHRYQRGILPAIRIAEGAQGAFDGQTWWIELEIQQTGFFFTEDSIKDVRFTTRWGGGSQLLPNGTWARAEGTTNLPLLTAGALPFNPSTVGPNGFFVPGAMGGNGISTGTPPNTPNWSYTVGSPPVTQTRTSLGVWDGWRGRSSSPLRVASELALLRIDEGLSEDQVRREPTEGPNRYTRLVFGVDLPGVNLPQRTVNDWIDIHHLSIIADDRAREGDVDIKVTLYRADPVPREPVPGFVGTITPPSFAGWGWVPAPGTTNPVLTNAAENFLTGWWPSRPTPTATLNPPFSGSGPFGTLITGNLAAPSFFNFTAATAQLRGESIFVYSAAPQRYEQFNPSDPDHLAMSAEDQRSFNLLPRNGNLIQGAPNSFPDLDPELVPNPVMTRPTDTEAITAGFIPAGATVDGLAPALRAGFWRVHPTPQRRFYGYGGSTAPTGTDLINLQAAFNYDSRLPAPPTVLDLPSFTPPMDRNGSFGTTPGLWESWGLAGTTTDWAFYGSYTTQTQSQTITLTPDTNVRSLYQRREGSVDDGTVTVARFGSLGLEFEIHTDHSAEDHWLLSGRRDWDFNRDRPIDGRRPIGAVTAMIDDTHHLTARAVLRELSAGALAATGGNPVTFEFDEGVQILGAKLWTNDASFARFNDADRTIWFDDRFNLADQFLGAVIERNTLTIRPEIGNSLGTLPAPNRVEAQEPRWRAAEIGVQFYLSVMPGYVHTFGRDNIDVTVIATDASNEAGGVFTESRTIAFVEDPIEVDTSVATVGNISPAEFGSLHVIPINDITITESASRNLEVGTRLWIGVEGGISRGFGAADHISVTAGSVEVVPEGAIGISPLRSDTHGAYVEITRVSNQNNAQIIFRDVKLSGRVFSETEYNVVVAGNAVAANWEEFLWLDSDMPTGIARGGIHGFFHEEPYLTAAFVFAGEDVGITELPAPAPAAPAPAPAPAPATREPVILTQNIAFVRPNGDVINPPFEMVPIPGTDSATAFISVRAIGDILGWELVWASPTATFTLPNGDELVFTLNESTASLNGTSMPMMNALGTPVAARNTNDRLMVPIRFFRDLGVNVQWLGGSPGRFMISVAHGSLTP